MKHQTQTILSSSQQKILNDQEASCFGKTYFSLCNLYNLPILTHVINHDQSSLLLDTDKVHKDEEWSPILIALKRNRDLMKISLYSSSNTVSTWKASRELISSSNNNLTPGGGRNRFQDGGKPIKAVVRILPDLIACVRDNLLYNQYLSILDISGLKLRENSLKLLAKGLLGNATVTHLSLSRCEIGDSGVFILSPSIRTVKYLRVLNLSACSLTEKGAHIISSFLKSLAVKRQSDWWELSLRNSPMDSINSATSTKLASKGFKDSPKPLKRLIICNNNLGDRGASPFIDLLFEEVGLAGVDLQFNGLTDVTANRAIEVLKINRDLVLLDLRNNTIGDFLMNKIGNYIAINQATKAIKAPGRDDDLIPLDSRDPLKLLFFEDNLRSTTRQTRSSVGKFNSNPIHRHDHKKWTNLKPENRQSSGTITESISNIISKKNPVQEVKFVQVKPKMITTTKFKQEVAVTNSKRMLTEAKRMLTERKDSGLDGRQQAGVQQHFPSTNVKHYVGQANSLLLEENSLLKEKIARLEKKDKHQVTHVSLGVAETIKEIKRNSEASPTIASLTRKEVPMAKTAAIPLKQIISKLEEEVINLHRKQQNSDPIDRDLIALLKNSLNELNEMIDTASLRF